MRGLSSIVALVFVVLLTVASAYVFLAYNLSSQATSSLEKRMKERLSWLSEEVLRVDRAYSPSPGVVEVDITALRGPVEMNDIYLYVNHRLLGSCEELNCSDQTGNGVLIMGESGSIKFPYSGPCSLRVLLEFRGSTTEYVGDVCSWHCRRLLTVFSEGNRDDYPVRVELSDDNFDVSNTMPSEIRVTDLNNKKLPYWIESWDASIGRGILWFKADLSDGNNQFYLYYCNPFAQDESNGFEVFDWFDFNDSNLLVVFHFNECSGSVTKNEVNGYTASISGALWVDTDRGCGLYFDGVDDYVEYATIHAPQTSYTMLVELNSFEDGTSTARDVTGMMGSTFYSIPLNLSVSGGFLRVYYQDASHILSAPIEVNKEIVCAVSANYGVDSNMYIDGSPVSSISGETWDTESETNLLVGAAVRGIWRYFHGVVDEYILFYRKLSYQEINTLSKGYLDNLSGVWVVRKRLDPEPRVTIGPEETGNWVLT